MGTALGESRFDIEGQPSAAHFRADRGRFAVVNSYFPKGSGKDRDVGPGAAAATPVLVTGDCNTAHSEIDIARPKSNIGNSGFFPEVRAELGRWLGAGWVDTFRAPHADEPDHYTWCRQ